MEALVASGAIPLLALTVKVDVPAVVGVPESTPAELRESPAGTAPEATENVGEGLPLAVKLYE